MDEMDTTTYTVKELDGGPQWMREYMWRDVLNDPWVWQEEGECWVFARYGSDARWVHGYPTEKHGPYVSAPLDQVEEPVPGYCRHGNYVGDPYGADHMCGACEMG